MAAQLQRLMDPTKGRSLMQINTALQRMGFCTWADLEPGMNIFYHSICQMYRFNHFISTYPASNQNIKFVEDHRNQDDFIRQRLNERLFDKIQKIEMKKLKEDKEIAKTKKMSKDARRKSEFDKRMAQGRKKGVISNVFYRSIIL